MSSFKHSVIFGFRFTVAGSMPEVVDDIMRNAANGFGGKVEFLITPNAYGVTRMLEKQHRDLFLYYNQSAYVLPDGMPIVWLSRLRKVTTLPQRITGSDLFPAVWNRIKQEKMGVTLVLPSEKAKGLFIQDYDRCDCYVPVMFDAKDDTYIEQFAGQVADGIIANNSRFLFLGLTFPKQEKMGRMVAEKLKQKGYTKGVLILLLGASFEFYFGLKQRAPEFFQKTGLEWLHRFLSEPRRLWKRYTVDNIRFLMLAAKELLSPAK